MSCNCIHIITAKSKIINPVGEVDASTFLCSLKRISRDEANTINSAYQKKTQISVAGYTCHYHTNKVVECIECPKYEEKK